MTDSDIKSARVRVLALFGILTLLQAALLFTDLSWVITFIPAMMMALALIISGIAIWHSRSRAIVECATIDGKTVSCCILCRHCSQKQNPWSKSFPIHHCGETNATVYDPMHIPSWCPHAAR